jgi:Coenzyme PQQ synthesis protein D (PqqD)
MGLLEPIELAPIKPISFVIQPGAGQESRFIRNPDLVSRNVAGETVVVPICRGVADLDAIYTFNGVGTHLWALLAESRTEAELGAFIEQRFAIGMEQALSDVRVFLTELQEVDLVRPV